MKIFVVIATFNGKHWYDRCFTSLRESEIPLQTVVIDNASNDGTVEYIRDNYPEIHLIASETNLGFGQANNKGIRYALDNGADYVFLLNQDAWIEPDTISELVRIHKENTGFGILSPIHLNAEKTAIESGLMHYVADYRITSPDLINDLYFGKTKDIYETQYVNAAAWLLPRKTLETVGGFDPIFFHYGEDDNYMQRVHYHGSKIGICPKIRVVHDTERRIKGNAQSAQSYTKNLLVELCNVNNNLSIRNLFAFSIRKTIQKAMIFKFHLAQYHFKNSIFIWKNRNKVTYSKNSNKNSMQNWL